MAFLFKSKKHQDRALGGAREGSNGSQGSMQSPDARARVVRDEKVNTHRSTPTGSLNSLDNDGLNNSPDQNFTPATLRRAQTGEQIPATRTANDNSAQVSVHPSTPPPEARICAVTPRRAMLQCPFKHVLILLVRTAAHRPLPVKSQLVPIPLVATGIKFHIASSWTLPAIWRRRQCDRLKGR